MKNEFQVLARRYAQAYLHVFGKNMTLDQAQKLPVVADILEKHRSLLIFAAVPQTEERSKRHIVDLFKMAGFDASLYSSLFDLVTADNRLVIMSEILRKIYTLYLESQGIMHFILESAIPLQDDERNILVAFLHKKTQKEIHYTLVVNPALIAGIKMYSDGLGFEHSIQQRLNVLSTKQWSTI